MEVFISDMPSTSEKIKEMTAQGSVPVPDPTVLTTQQLLREIATSREVVEKTVDGVRETIETRIAGMDKAIELLQRTNDKFPNQILDAVKQLQEVHDEKFHSIAVQFTERDTRTEQTSRDSKVAVDAALQAAKEAVGEQNKSNALAIAKSEATFTKQIDQIGVLISTMQKAIDDKIDDIKSRIQSIESHSKGSVETFGRDQQQQNWGIGIAIAVIVGLASIGVAIAALLIRHS
jgi:hypothetical protein